MKKFIEVTSDDKDIFINIAHIVDVVGNNITLDNGQSYRCEESYEEIVKYICLATREV